MSDDRITDRRRQLLLIGSVAVAVFMARLDIYIVSISLPTIARYFHVGTDAVAWVSMGYLLLSCGSMMRVGRLADGVSPRALFLWGYGIFTVGSLLSGLSTSLSLLIAFRCLQGLGGAVLVIVTYTAVSRFLPDDKVGGAMGILATAGALGIAVGSPLGGLLTERLSWQWVFFVNVPIGLVAIPLAFRSIPGRSQPVRRAAGLDYLGVALSFLTVASFIMALDVGQNEGWGAPLVPALLVLSAIAAILFVVRQMKARDPLVSPLLLRDRRFLLANAVTVFGLILMGGNSFLMPFLLELGKGSSTERAGLVLLVYSATFVVLSPFTGRLADRCAPWRLCAAGMAVGVVACLLFAFTLGATGSAVVIIFLVGLAAVYALFMAPNAKQVLGSAPSELKGAASAVFGTVYTLSLLLGVNAFETLYAETRAAQGEAVAAVSNGAWWVPGFSAAYVLGAAACAAALLLCLATPRVARVVRSAAERSTAAELLRSSG